jgi:hypothetical protein
MSGACSMLGGAEKLTLFQSENLNERDCLENPGVKNSVA